MTMGRRKINHEQVAARFPAGTLATIAWLLEPGETRTSFLQTAIARELERRLVRRAAVRVAGRDEAQHGLNDTWPGDPYP